MSEATISSVAIGRECALSTRLRTAPSRAPEGPCRPTNHPMGTAPRGGGDREGEHLELSLMCEGQSSGSSGDVEASSIW
jgi:hypothetical protein